MTTATPRSTSSTTSSSVWAAWPEPSYANLRLLTDPEPFCGRLARRRATVAVVAAGVTVAIVVTGLLMANSRIQDEPAPIAT